MQFSIPDNIFACEAYWRAEVWEEGGIEAAMLLAGWSSTERHRRRESLLFFFSVLNWRRIGHRVLLIPALDSGSWRLVIRIELILLLCLFLRKVVVLFWVDLVLVIVLKDMIFLVRLVVSDGCYAFWVRLVALIFMQGFCSFSLLPHLAQLLLQLSDFFLCLIQLPSVLIHSFIFCVSVVLAFLVCNSLWHLSCLHCLFFFRPHSLDNFVVIRLLSFLDATHSILPSLLLLHNLQTRHFFDPFGLSLLISPSH